ncbi:peptidyl-prolyl cis-trans isomerase sig-7 [Lutzomyia longipalpis]|uniref:peptidyl-prolyl cis-trans isomerase sig-7 n=1 Tax=Lutzomyia longipalpis TaxID=7200 RepID=UPI0024838FAC|nr:peptidyl-prolyl cis-trans isomerase sig-7 [Lutzomyia longipalpis]
MSVVIETTLGDLTVDLFIKERPLTCLNFLKLCKLKFYNYNLFHSIQHGFIAQTGDPTGSGHSGTSIWGVIEGPHKRYFEGEALPKIRHTEVGLLSMVSSGGNMIGSQFFFTLGQDLTSLDGVHCVIGEVVEGHDVLRQLNEVICDEKYRPYKDVRITHTVILEDPFDDPRGFREPTRSPSPTPRRLQGGRIAADEEIDDTQGKTEEEITEILQDQEAKARATILEIVGDLPDADIAPPENVLFVCKLNPVTTDDDLELIFSRFGKINSCEVIRDQTTGASLQYAFVEFDEQKSCEDAYFKMNNVLIDDRRIHVDFSQSVSKVKWRGKGRGVYHVKEERKKQDGRKDENNFSNERRRDDERSRRNQDFRRRSRERSHEMRRNYSPPAAPRRSDSSRHHHNEKNRSPAQRRGDSSRYANDRQRSGGRSRSPQRNSTRRSHSRSDQIAHASRRSRISRSPERQRVSSSQSNGRDRKRTERVESSSSEREKEEKRKKQKRNKTKKSKKSRTSSDDSSSSDSQDYRKSNKKKKKKHKKDR